MRRQASNVVRVGPVYLEQDGDNVKLMLINGNNAVRAIMDGEDLIELTHTLCKISLDFISKKYEDECDKISNIKEALERKKAELSNAVDGYEAKLHKLNICKLEEGLFKLEKEKEWSERAMKALESVVEALKVS